MTPHIFKRFLGVTALGSVLYLRTQDQNFVTTPLAYLTLDSEALTTQISSRTSVLARFVRTMKALVDLTILYKTVSTNNDVACREGDLSDIHSKGADIVLNLCRKNGALFIKAGQHAATLSPALPREYVEKLQTLQDKAPARSFEEVKKVLRKELNMKDDYELISERKNDSTPFLSIDPTPLGSASLAQVHRGKLRTGKEVAIKVQHPDLLLNISADIKLLYLANKLASTIFRKDDFNLKWAIQDLQVKLRKESDFSIEASNLKMVKSFISNCKSLEKRIILPELFESLSSKKVLVMSYIDGIPIRNLQAQKGKGDFAHLRNALVEFWAKMIFDWGFIHCDPHPGNFLWCSNSKKIAVLDHGLYLHLSEHFRFHLAGLWKAMMINDAESFMLHSHELKIKPELAQALPFLLINRPLKVKSPLGYPASMSDSDKAAFLSSIGLVNISVESVFHLMSKIPRDLAWVMRTMHLMKNLFDSLGGSDRYESIRKLYNMVLGNDFIYMDTTQLSTIALRVYRKFGIS